MMISRFIGHLRKQQWTGALIELVIVIVGIFVGLQVNNWNTVRHQHQAAYELLGELRANIALEIDVKSHALMRDEKLIHNVENAIAVVQGMKHAQSLSPDECAAIWMSGHQMFYASDNASFFALLTPTRLSIIRDPKLRMVLLSYDSYHERVARNIDWITAQFITVTDKFPNVLPRRLDLNSPDLSDVTCNLEKIRASQALQNILMSNLGRAYGILHMEQEDLARLKQLKAEVDGYRP